MELHAVASGAIVWRPLPHETGVEASDLPAAALTHFCFSSQKTL